MRKLLVPLTLSISLFFTSSIFAVNLINADKIQPITTINSTKPTEVEMASKNYVEKGKTDVKSYKLIPFNDRLYFTDIDKTFTFPNMVALSVYYAPKNSDIKVSFCKTADIIVMSKQEFADFNLSNLGKESTIINDGNNVIIVVPNYEGLSKFPMMNKADSDAYKYAVENAYKNVVPFELNNEDGYIKGVNVDYTFNFPEGTSFEVYNDTFNDSTGAIEKLNFIPEIKQFKDIPSVIMELYVYNKADFDNVTGQIKVKETNDYVFSVKINSTTKFNTVYGKNLYKQYYDILTDNLFTNVKNAIVFTEADTPEPKAEVTVVEPDKNTVTDIKLFVDGEKTDVSVKKIGGTDYLPARTILEKLGYTISWDEKTSSIIATKGNDTYKFVLGSKTYFHNNKEIGLEFAPVSDGTSYIPVESIQGLLGHHYFVIGNSIYIKTEK